MDDLTAQERELITMFRRLRSFSAIVHRNGRWRVVIADEEDGTTKAGDGDDFREGLGRPQRQEVR